MQTPLLNISQSFSYYRPRTELAISEVMGLGFRRFDYTWLHRASGCKANNFVYCRNQAEFYALLVEWNTEEWSYFRKL